MDQGFFGDNQVEYETGSDDVSLYQLLKLIRALKGKQKLDRQERIKKQICYVQRLC